MRKIRAVMLDLDGTLLDTAGDLAAAANRMLAGMGLAPRTITEISNFVGKGIPRLVERCLTGELEGKANPEQLKRALALFSAAYDEESGRHVCLYPGVVEGLRELAADGIRLACVTNKTERFTLPLLERTGLAQHFAAIVSGDTAARPKPDAAPYQHACAQLAVATAEALVVGDSANDVIAAHAAGIPVLCVPYGYREGRSVEALGADAIVADLRAVAAYVRARNR